MRADTATEPKSLPPNPVGCGTEKVDLVSNNQGAIPIHLETVEDLLSNPQMFLPCRVCRINDVEHEVRVGGLLEGRTERRDQVVG